MFFDLLIAVALIMRVFIFRGFRKKTAELGRALSDLAQKEKAFDETVSTEVDHCLSQEKKQLSGQWDEFHHARNKASRALQRIVDSAYKFKVKTLLSGNTVNNWQDKYDQLRKERDAYAAISEKITFLEFGDNAEWEGVKQQFLDKVALLEKTQEEKEYQAELKRQMREEKQRQDELDRQQREAEEVAQRLVSSSIYRKKLCSSLKVLTEKSWKGSAWRWSKKFRTCISSMNAPNPWPSSRSRGTCM